MVILICDDNKSFAQQLQEQICLELQKMKWDAKVLICQNETEVVEKVRQNKVDAIFLDIDMEKLSGFDIAKILSCDKDSPYIIFVSNLEYLVYDSFEYHPFWFLRKRDMEQISLVLSKLKKEMGFKKEVYSFEANGRFVQIKLADIIYIESDNHYINIYTEKEVYKQKVKISDVTKTLEPYYFIRTHIGFLVNALYIKQIQKQNMVLANGKLIPISRAQMQNVKNSFIAYVRERKV